MAHSTVLILTFVMMAAVQTPWNVRWPVSKDRVRFGCHS